MPAKYTHVCTGTHSATNKTASVVKTPMEYAEIKGDVRVCDYAKGAHSNSQTHDDIKNAKEKRTAWPCPRSHQSAEHSSALRLKREAGQSAEKEFGYPEWVDWFVKGCPKESCFTGSKNSSGFEYSPVPIEYSPCVPEFVHIHPPEDHDRRPRLPEPPEMLSTLKQGIRHPFQITHRKKEMQTRLDRLTDEHKAFAFPPGTKRFIDDAYYSTQPAINLVENWDLVRSEAWTHNFPECAIRPYLLAFNRDKYKFFRERLPMPKKRVIDIPGNRTTHWHNWTIRPLRTSYNESWRKDIRVPDNWFGPTPSNICLTYT